MFEDKWKIPIITLLLINILEYPAPFFIKSFLAKIEVA